MARQQRQDPDEGYHHVMNRGVDRMNVYVDDHDRRRFLDLLAEAAWEFNVSINAFCLLGNHYHLVLHCPTGGISDVMWKLGSCYARYFNDRHGRDGPLCRSRFASKVVTDELYMWHLIRYVHRNSLDLGVAPDAWPWSSCQAYLGLRKAPDWLEIRTIQGLIGGPDRHRVALSIAQPADAAPVTAHDPWSAHNRWVLDEIGRLVLLATQLGGVDERRQLDLVLVAAAELGFQIDTVASALNSRSSTIRSKLSRIRRRAQVDPSIETGVRALLQARHRQARAA